MQIASSGEACGFHLLAFSLCPITLPRVSPQTLAIRPPVGPLDGLIKTLLRTTFPSDPAILIDQDSMGGRGPTIRLRCVTGNSNGEAILPRVHDIFGDGQMLISQGNRHQTSALPIGLQCVQMGRHGYGTLVATASFRRTGKQGFQAIDPERTSRIWQLKTYY